MIKAIGWTEKGTMFLRWSVSEKKLSLIFPEACKELFSGRLGQKEIPKLMELGGS